MKKLQRRFAPPPAALPWTQRADFIGIHRRSVGSLEELEEKDLDFEDRGRRATRPRSKCSKTLAPNSKEARKETRNVLRVQTC
jgi:hypothetical protein